jgi:hypothetical protein
VRNSARAWCEPSFRAARSDSARQLRPNRMLREEAQGRSRITTRLHSGALRELLLQIADVEAISAWWIASPSRSTTQTCVSSIEPSG